MPRKSTGAPTDSPRSDWLKFITTRSGAPSGSRIASPSSEPRRNVVLFGACAPTLWSGGDWNARPPTITVASDCVLSLKPLESSRRSTPLACHQRELRADVLVVRRVDEHLHRHAGAVLVEREADHLADLHAPVVDRRADVDRAERLAVQR